MKKYLKIIIILFIIIIISILLFSPLNRYLDFSQLFTQRESLLLLVHENFLKSMMIYLIIFITVVAFSIPGATILTIMGGFLFGPILAMLFTNIGATTGSFIILLVSRYLAADMIQNRFQKRLKSFNRELTENSTSYLLSVRLIPLFPFFIISILAGLTDLSKRKFIWTTSLGIIPVSFVFSYVGYASSTSAEGSIMTKEIYIALILLALMGTIPPIFKRVKKAKKES